MDGFPMATDEKVDSHRLDKWLWHTRFYKTRSLATAAITGGKVHLNAERVKPAHRVRVGDRLSLSLQGIVGEFEVLGLPARRGPAAEAQAQYLETPASAERRAKLREQQRLAQASRPRPDTRPDKRDRRRLMRLQRDQT
ncbi:MAG TPA: S4 domain-containing protein [Steroidobacteraceae bacterium]